LALVETGAHPSAAVDHQRRGAVAGPPLEVFHRGISRVSGTENPAAIRIEFGMLLRDLGDAAAEATSGDDDQNCVHAD